MLEFVHEDEILIKYKTEEYSGGITYEELIDKWDYQEKEEIDDNCSYEFAYIDGKNLFFAITLYSDQTGITGIWDMEEKKFTHINDGAYARFPFVYKAVFYSLDYVHHYDVKPHYVLAKWPLDQVDFYDTELYDEITEYTLEGDMLTFNIDGAVATFTLDEDKDIEDFAIIRTAV